MGIIQLAHGGGGKFTEELVEEVFLRAYSPDSGEALEDSAILDSTAMRWAFSSDSFTVKPLFFPGGDIGRLAVCGTVNDLLMRGARPRYLSSSFIIEEGLEIETLKAVVASMAKACEEAGVKIVTGDTKVVPKGEVDELFINTSGIGEVEPELDISIKNAKPGDAIIISGTIGDHGMAILSTRGSFSFDPPLESDCAPLVEIVEAIKKFPGAVKLLRDPTRGGVAEVLYNISEASGVGIEILEEALPVKPQVQSACEMLGLDILQLANEGKLLAVVESSSAEKLLKEIQGCPYGEDATIIGTVDDTGMVKMKTRFGTSRIITRPSGELIPRIC